MMIVNSQIAHKRKLFIFIYIVHQMILIMENTKNERIMMKNKRMRNNGCGHNGV